MCFLFLTYYRKWDKWEAKEPQTKDVGIWDPHGGNLECTWLKSVTLEVGIRNPIPLWILLHGVKCFCFERSDAIKWIIFSVLSMCYGQTTLAYRTLSNPSGRILLFFNAVKQMDFSKLVIGIFCPSESIQRPLSSFWSDKIHLLL